MDYKKKYERLLGLVTHKGHNMSYSDCEPGMYVRLQLKDDSIKKGIFIETIITQPDDTVTGVFLLDGKYEIIKFTNIVQMHLIGAFDLAGG